jgi:site-specific recombinase XerD
MASLQKAHGEFINHLKERNRAHATVLAYGKDIDQLIEFLQELERANISEISGDDIQAFLAKLLKNGYTPKSVSRKTNAVKTFFRFLKVNEYITDNPAALVSHPKFETKPPRILSETEYRAMRDAVSSDPRTYAIVELLLQTGLRIGELARLRLEDVKFGTGNKDGELNVCPFNRHECRVIPLNQKAQKALKTYLDIRPKSARSKHLFITRTGKPLMVRNIRATIMRYFDIAGIENASVNALRHTFIAQHLKKGASLVLVSKIAGHKRVSTTEKYLEHINVDVKQEKMELAEL